jgi:hypothetical protein
VLQETREILISRDLSRSEAKNNLNTYFLFGIAERVAYSARQRFSDEFLPNLLTQNSREDPVFASPLPLLSKWMIYITAFPPAVVVPIITLKGDEAATANCWGFPCRALGALVQWGNRSFCQWRSPLRLRMSSR